MVDKSTGVLCVKIVYSFSLSDKILSVFVKSNGQFCTFTDLVMQISCLPNTMTAMLREFGTDWVR